MINEMLWSRRARRNIVAVAMTLLFVGRVDALSISKVLKPSPYAQRGTLSRQHSRTDYFLKSLPPRRTLISPRPLNPFVPYQSGLQLSRNNNGVTPKPANKTRATAVYALMLANLVVFLADKVFRYNFVANNFYLFHRRWKWWQTLTTCFCHMDRSHLSNNLFMLLLFGRSVEDDQGWFGLLFSYIFCGVFASLASLSLLAKGTVSIGASGAVFGLFVVSTLGRFSLRDLDWRKVVEVAVLGEFVFRQLASEISTAANGGTRGINHVAHLSGAAAGALMVFVMKFTVTKYEQRTQRNG